jgi:transketolase
VPVKTKPLTHDDKIIRLIRGFAMDGPLAAKSGHQGTAMSLAPLAHVLFDRVMNYDPADPHWPDRDRFVLSNGHASILLYSMLYLNGFDVTLDDLKKFRSWGSRTPGHPEVHHTAGVEVTTGPLGQGIANAVGLAMAEAHLRATHGDEIQSHFTYVIAGDGCMMEGVSHEAASLAGHLGLGRLVVIYDDNKITIDGATDLAFSDNTAERFRAYGWHVDEVGEIANDCDRLEAAITRAKKVTGKPSLIVLKSHIAYPSPTFLDDHEAHGNPFKAEHVTEAKKVMGIPDEPFYAPEALVDRQRNASTKRGARAHDAWKKRFSRWKGDKAAWKAAWSAPAKNWAKPLPKSKPGESIATRVAFQKALNATAPNLPGLLSGSADLTGNNGVKLDGATNFSKKNPGGTQVRYGVREHGMGAAVNGLALHGGILPIGATFFVFSDYNRPTLRLASMSRAKAVYVYSHDSVGVGEDGPTHQPVEQLMSLRLIPGLQVIRPADANETAEAWRTAVEHDGPTALILSRQNVVVTTDGSAVAQGAGIVVDASRPQVVLVGTGSEVAVCVEAAKLLAADGIRARVVSMPSMDRFAAQPAAYQRSILPPKLPTVSVEAGATLGWDRYADVSVGIDRFGASAPGATVMDKLGINPTNVAKQAAKLVARSGR